MIGKCYWIYKFDPQVITIDDLRIGNYFLKANLNSTDFSKITIDDICVLMNSSHLQFEAVGKICDIDFNDRSIRLKITHKPRQLGNLKALAESMNSVLTNKIKKMSNSKFNILSQNDFDQIFKSWWGIKQLSSDL